MTGKRVAWTTSLMLLVFVPKSFSQTYCQTIALAQRFVSIMRTISADNLSIEKPARGEHAG